MTAKRGRPRSEVAQKAILSTALELLEDKGLARLTIEAVAQKAGVGKPTIYRYWANAQELAMAALIAQASDAAEVPASPAGLNALRRQLYRVIARFSTKAGKQTSMLLATADSDSEISKAFRNQVVLQSRKEGHAILLDILAEGGQPTLPIESLLDMIYGPIFYRILAKHAPLDAALADDIVDMVTLLIANSDRTIADQP